jgi:hypothetical protein
MALINDPNVTAQLAALANQGTIDTNTIVSLLNSVLPAGQQIAVGSGVTTGIYKRFGDFDKVNAKLEVVTTGMWANDSGSLTSYFTSSTQANSANGIYYYNIFDKNPSTDSSAQIQYAVAYGNVDGGGSESLTTNDNSLLATKATYAQYRSMLLDNPANKFQFENASGVATDSDSIYIINISRARFREEMDAGNWSLKLSGSNGLYTFIDDSGKKFGDTFGKAGRVFKIVSGSLNLGTQNEATVVSPTASNGLGYGTFYPDRGIIVLNSAAIGNTIGIVGEVGFANTGSLVGSNLTTHEAYNHKLLHYAIKKGGDFEARRTEDVETQHFFVRATNREFNYSNNPTYVNTDGTFAETTFVSDPQTFITTIGLYNDANEMIAVAKTSQPIVKSFDKEVLIKVKLSF